MSYSVQRPAGQSPLWKRGRPALARLDVELTERCNHGCVHCYINRPAGDRDARRREAPAAAVASVLAEAAGLGCLVVRFTGGEPLLRPDFEEIYIHARRLGMKVVLLTNAALITPRLADLFARTPSLERIEITLYGLTAQVHERVTRVPGAFAGVREGLRLLRERRVPYALRGVVLPETRDEIVDERLWTAFLPEPAYRPGRVVSLNLRGRRDDEPRNDAIRARRLPPEEHADFLSAGDRGAYVRETAAFLSWSSKPRGDRLFTCGAGAGRAAVDAYGTVQPCLLLRHPDTVVPPGRGGLEHAVKVVFPRLRERRAADPAYLARCAVCPLADFCEQCPAQSWMEHGTLDTPVDYHCRAAHARARDVGLLAPGERAWTVTDWTDRLRSGPDGGERDDRTDRP